MRLWYVVDLFICCFQFFMYSWYVCVVICLECVFLSIIIIIRWVKWRPKLNSCLLNFWLRTWLHRCVNLAIRQTASKTHLHNIPHLLIIIDLFLTWFILSFIFFSFAFAFAFHIRYGYWNAFLHNAYTHISRFTEYKCNQIFMSIMKLTAITMIFWRPERRFVSKNVYPFEWIVEMIWHLLKFGQIPWGNIFHSNIFLAKVWYF